MRDRSHHYRDHHGHAMPLEEVQGLLLPSSRTGNRGPLNVTIVQVGRGNGGGADGGSDLLRLEPPPDLKPVPSPLSDTSTTLPSDNNDTLTGGVDSRLLLGIGGDRTWEGRYHMKEHRRAGKATFQGQVYNFLERPTGWKCFLYHFSVPVAIYWQERKEKGNAESEMGIDIGKLRNYVSSVEENMMDAMSGYIPPLSSALNNICMVCMGQK